LPGIVVAVDETTGGDVTMGTTGIDSETVLVIGATPIVGTAAAELTPRLPISVESRGIPARAAPPGVVGVEDAVTLFEPEPHIPDIPDVSIMPEGVDMPALRGIPDVVDIPEVEEIPLDVLADNAVLPAIAPVAGIEPTTDIPPPS
jgi:hypothetical protein